MIITGRAPGEQLCWSELWMRFSARTVLHDGDGRSAPFRVGQLPKFGEDGSSCGGDAFGFALVGYGGSQGAAGTHWRLCSEHGVGIDRKQVTVLESSYQQLTSAPIRR